ncbi:MAG: hypothetical protein U9R02_04415 [Thermodesulfobacteriota bacterium]|nr:hypothetical protein [Thermodesulfobacteriota bacterium]
MVRNQWSEVRGQKSEVRGQRSEVRGQRSGIRGLEPQNSRIMNRRIPACHALQLVLR